jgi:hypothetical protein
MEWPGIEPGPLYKEAVAYLSHGMAHISSHTSSMKAIQADT